MSTHPKGMGALKVLCVDDNYDVLRALKSAIDRVDGQEVVGILSTTRALSEHVSELNPDILILDYGLPGEDSMGALRTLLEERRELRCLVLTGYDDLGTMQKAIEAGAERCMCKDVEMSDVIKAIRGDGNDGTGRDGTRA